MHNWRMEEGFSSLFLSAKSDSKKKRSETEDDLHFKPFFLIFDVKTSRLYHNCAL